MPPLQGHYPKSAHANSYERNFESVYKKRKMQRNERINSELQNSYGNLD